MSVQELHRTATSKHAGPLAVDPVLASYSLPVALASHALLASPAPANFGTTHRTLSLRTSKVGLPNAHLSVYRMIDDLPGQIADERHPCLDLFRMIFNDCLIHLVINFALFHAPGPSACSAGVLSGGNTSGPSAVGE